jgi:hypothetical protein
MHVRAFICAIACLTLPVLAACQDGQLRLPPFPELQQKATESVDIDIGSLGLKLASAFVDDDDSHGVHVKKLLRGLKSVRIRSYEFSSDVVLPDAEIGQLRRQLSAPGWSPLVHTHDRDSNEDVDIYLCHDEHAARELAIIASSSRELTIVDIVGAVELNQVGELRSLFTPSRIGDMQLGSHGR